MIGFLDEFWNSITSATEGTVEWFQSLGNAVAGALGNLLFYPLRAIVDFGLAIAYLFSQLYQIILYILAPFLFFINYLEGLFVAWLTPQTLAAPVLFNAEIIAVIKAIPMVSTFFIIVLACFWFVVFNKTLHTLKH